MQVSKRTAPLTTPLGTARLPQGSQEGAEPTSPTHGALTGDQAQIARRPGEQPSLQDLVAKAQAAMQAQRNQAPAAAPNLPATNTDAEAPKAIANALEASQEVFQVKVIGEDGKATFLANGNTIAVIEGKALDANAGSKDWLKGIQQIYELDDKTLATIASTMDKRQEKASKQLEANAPLEASAIEKLPAEHQQQFKRLAEATDFDPGARLALQMLLLGGKTTPALLDALAKLAAQPVAKGLDSGSLVADLIQEIHLPGTIAQYNRGTCTVTTVQTLLAREKPEEYARIVAGLASPEGKVKLADGTTIAREPGTELPDDTPRTASARLWQAAMMELGNGRDDYDNAKDVNITPDGQKRDAGLAAEQTARVLQAVTGQTTDTKDLSYYTLTQQMIEQSSPEEIDRLNAMTPDAYEAHMRERVSQLRPKLAEEAVLSQLESGRSLVVGLDWGERDAMGRIHGGHELLATRVSRDEGGQTWIHLSNPWGQQEKLPKDEFFKRINEFHVPKH